jgi:peptide/nickel transport system permease protein
MLQFAARRFIARRFIHAIPILFGVTVVAFMLVRLMPGNIADILSPPNAPAEVRERIENIYGLDRPIWEQYARWMGEILQGNFGVQMGSGRSIAVQLTSAIQNTLKITIFGALFGFAFGVLFGWLAARANGRWPDKLFSLVTITGVSVPHYWLAILMVTLLAVELNWLPAQGMGPPGLPLTWEHWQYMVLPVFTLSLIPMGVVGRLVRAAVLEVLSQEFVSALGSKGLPGRRITLHVAKNAAPPVLAVMGLQFGYLLGGSILVETVFNWPGTGQLLNQAIFSRDMSTIQVTVLVLAFMFVLVNLAVDLLQAVADPRMRR